MLGAARVSECIPDASSQIQIVFGAGIVSGLVALLGYWLHARVGRPQTGDGHKDGVSE